VAGFLGKANLLPGRFVGLADDVTVMVRPENVVIGNQGGRTFEAFVGQAVMEGAIVQYTLDHNGTRITARTFHHGAPTYKPGDSVSISFPADRFHILPKS
jgi:ABC-type Fe3+/spermidine/putrescine transport system ATPase subunit